jgi:hypothetical protein
MQRFAGTPTPRADEHAERAGLREAANTATIADSAERRLGRRKRFNEDRACAHGSMLSLQGSGRLPEQPAVLPPPQ